MKKDFGIYIKKLSEYKEKHNFEYSEIADILDTTTRSIRRWLKGKYQPLPIYRKKIIELVDSDYKDNYENNRRKIDLKYNLNHRMSARIYQSLKRNKSIKHWEDLVNYTLTDLIRRLKETMPEGYTWQDFLEGKLHIDHIIPISAFNFNEFIHIDFKRCWSLENLRLLPARENLAKSNHLSQPFQPALQI